MADQELAPLARMFSGDGLVGGGATPLANQLQAIARIVLRSALRRYPSALDLSFVHAAVIGGIGTFGPIAARDLASLLTMHEGQLSRSIHVLSDDGLVERVADPADSRRKMLMLTRVGKQLHKKIIAIQKDREERLLAGVSDQDRAAFFDVLNRIRANGEAMLAVDSQAD